MEHPEVSFSSNPVIVDFSLEAIRERFFAQDARLIAAAEQLARVVSELPPSPAYPQVVPRAIVVGGFVRDVIAGARPTDLDMEVFGVAPEHLEALLEERYPGLVSSVGRAFGILKIHLGKGIEFDVSIPRIDSKTGSGHRGFRIDSDPGLSVAQATLRRDFTINAMGFDPITGELLDPFEGLKDLEWHILRVVDPATFPDDPLRVYRAVRFVACFELTVATETEKLLKRMVAQGVLKDLSREHVTEEWKKMLLGAPRPSVGFGYAYDLGISAQDPCWKMSEMDWFAGSVRLDAAAEQSYIEGLSAGETLMLAWGMFFSDETLLRSALSALTFPESVQMGAYSVLRSRALVRSLVDQLRLPDAERARVNAIRLYLKAMQPLSGKGIQIAFWIECQVEGFAEPDEILDLIHQMADLIEEYQLETVGMQPLFSGSDLIALGIPPGPEMGKLIREIEDLRDQGKIATKDEAREWIVGSMT